MKSRIKCVVLDLDGTLLTPERKITQEVKEAIWSAKSSGIKIVLCTGRPLSGVKDILEELNLTGEDDFVITFNGALLQRGNGEIVVQKTLKSKTWVELAELAQKKGLFIHAVTNLGIYSPNNQIGKYTVQESYWVNLPLYYSFIDNIANQEINKIVISEEPETLSDVISSLPQGTLKEYNVVKSAPYCLEFMSEKVSKGEGVKSLIQNLGLELSEVMAIGDEENDRSMLEMVGTPVVMENGNPNLKKIAKYITRSNAESGVAFAIKQWAL